MGRSDGVATHLGQVKPGASRKKEHGAAEMCGNAHSRNCSSEKAAFIDKSANGRGCGNLYCKAAMPVYHICYLIILAVRL
jgi:hypothetical protein